MLQFQKQTCVHNIAADFVTLETDICTNFPEMLKITATGIYKLIITHLI